MMASTKKDLEKAELRLLLAQAEKLRAEIEAAAAILDRLDCKIDVYAEMHSLRGYMDEL